MPATEKNANAFDMTSLSAVNSGYSLMLINNSTNEGQLVTMTDLATMILNEIRNKTFTATELGQSSASTLPAAISSLNSAIGNLEVGGRNLLLDTDAPSLTKVAAQANRYFSDSTNGYVIPEYIKITDAPINVENGARFTVETAQNSDARRSIAWYLGGSLVPMEDGQKYTLSFYARVTSGTTMKMTLLYGIKGYSIHPINITGDTWKRYSWTFTFSQATTKDEEANGARIYFGCTCRLAGVLELCGYKLERGAVVTDWTPALEDILHLIGQ